MPSAAEARSFGRRNAMHVHMDSSIQAHKFFSHCLVEYLSQLLCMQWLSHGCLSRAESSWTEKYYRDNILILSWYIPDMILQWSCTKYSYKMTSKNIDGGEHTDIIPIYIVLHVQHDVFVARLAVLEAVGPKHDRFRCRGCCWRSHKGCWTRFTHGFQGGRDGHLPCSLTSLTPERSQQDTRKLFRKSENKKEPCKQQLQTNPR